MAAMERILVTMLLGAVVLSLGGCAINATVSDSGDDTVMLSGNDPVSYSSGTPLRGSPAIVTRIEGYSYRFATPGNREAFLREPKKYSPQYGGWCANNMVFALKRPGSPAVFEVVDGRLYMFDSPQSRAYWALDRKRNVETANAYWLDEARDTAWRWQNLKRSVFSVPHYKSNDELGAEYLRRTGQALPSR